MLLLRWPRYIRTILGTLALTTVCSCYINAEDASNSTKLSDRLKKIKASAPVNAGSGGAIKPPTNPHYNKILKSVALILCENTDGSTCSGTGWVLDAEQRLLVTNDHVIEGFTDCKVFFPEFIDGQLVTDPAKSIVPARAIALKWSTATRPVILPSSKSRNCRPTSSNWNWRRTVLLPVKTSTRLQERRRFTKPLDLLNRSRPTNRARHSSQWLRSRVTRIRHGYQPRQQRRPGLR